MLTKIPAPVCFRFLVISSSNFPPYIDSPPRPVPVRASAINTVIFVKCKKWKVLVQIISGSFYLNVSSICIGTKVEEWIDQRHDRTCWVATLDDHISYNSMKGDSIVISSMSQGCHVIARSGCMFVIQFNNKASLYFKIWKDTLQQK